MRHDDVVWTRWAEVDRVFERALDVPEPEREAWVERACEADRELRDAVLDLLARSRSEDVRVSRPGEELMRAVLPADVADRPGSLSPGDVVGRYRIVEELGRGGMATVYEAERSDGVYRQVVALKVLRRGLDTDRIVERFLAERQILSDFAHPNVARLLDGGATADGRPFLVMEKVDGRPLTEWADERRADLRSRLELFLQVTEAVKEAHRRLVVHRDLKPSNILVAASGRVKLLDFGIAKLLDPDAGDSDLTLLGAYPLTRRYASPEQLRGEPVTVSSDLYQLGLILFELLAGLPPFDGAAADRSAEELRSPPRIGHAIAGAEPERLAAIAEARASSPRALQRDVRGDLETIVRKALEPDPQDRYRSVEDLAGDVRRHLEGQPIRARPASRALRVRKWIGRNPWAPPVAALLLLAAAGYAATLTLTAERLERERNEARAQAERAERVTGFLTGLFEVTEPNQAGGDDTLTVLELLDMSAARAATGFEDQPATRAEVLSAIGSMYVARGHFERGAPLLERAVDVGRTSAGDPAELVRDLRRLATAVHTDRERAVRLLEEAVAVAERELGPDDARLAAALTDLAARLSQSLSPAEQERSRVALDRALAILRAQEGDVRAELAAALNLSGLGVGLDGLPRLEEALELRRSLYGEEHTAVAATLSDMALVLEPFDPAASDTLLERAAAINRRIHGPDHPQTLSILNNLAGRYRDRGDYGKAEPLYREILRRRREAYPADSMAHAYSMHGLGWSLTEIGRADEAEPLLREVVRLVDPGPEHPSVVFQVARSTLGRCLAAQGRYEEAERLLVESYERVTAHFPNSMFVPLLLDRLVDFYDAWGRPKRAAEYRAQSQG